MKLITMFLVASFSIASVSTVQAGPAEDICKHHLHKKEKSLQERKADFYSCQGNYYNNKSKRYNFRRR